MLRHTAIYVRQSADRADSVSLETQEQLCRLDTQPGEPVTVYRDGGYSGRTTDRPALRAMLRAAERGEIGRILVYKLDRISRNLADFTQLLRLFEQQRIEFQSHSERFETASPMGQAMQSLLMVFAQLERETISARVRDSAFARAKLGFDPGGPPPIGYKKVPGLLHGRRTKLLVPDESAAETVRGGFVQYAAKGSLAGVCETWAQHGFLTQRGGQWSTGTLCRVLRNPVYVQADSAVYAHLSRLGAELIVPDPPPLGKGVCLYADRRVNHARMTDLHGVLAVAGQHDGIVPAAVWLRCQERLTQSRFLRTRGRGRTWLSGRVFCMRCGAAMTVTQGRSAAYLVCGGRKRGKCIGAGAVWRLDIAEKLIGNVLAELLRRLREMPVSAPKDRDTEQALAAIALRREALLRQMADPAGGAVAALAEAVAMLDAQAAAVRGRAEKKPASGRGLPSWESCGDAEKRVIVQTLLRGAYFSGNRIDCFTSGCD